VSEGEILVTENKLHFLCPFPFDLFALYDRGNSQSYFNYSYRAVHEFHKEAHGNEHEIF